MPKTVSLYFSEENITWVASKLSGASGALGEEETELRNCLLFFGCVSKEFRIIVSNMVYWMDNSSLPWAAYRALMEFCLVTLDKRPGVHPLGIGETIHRSISKLITRAAGDQ